jgi:hypothetical protein
MLMTDSVHDELSTELRRAAKEAGTAWIPMRRRIAIPFANLRRIGARRFVRRVSRSEYVLTGRFHAVTISIATRTPFLAFSSNTRKIEALLHDVFGSEHRLLRHVGDAAERMRAGNLSLDAVERKAIDDYLNLSRVRSYEMFEALARDVRSKSSL